MNTVVLKLNGVGEPTGYVLKGSAIKVEPSHNTSNWGININLTNQGSGSVTCCVKCYNDKLYSSVEHTTELTPYTQHSDDYGNIIYTYNFTFSSSKKIYAGVNATWVVLEDALNKISMFTVNDSSGSNSRDKEIYKFDFRSIIDSVGKDNLKSVTCVYSTNLKPFDIEYLSKFRKIKSINVNGLTNIEGDISAFENFDLANIVLLSVSYTNIYGELAPVLDAIGAALVSAGVSSRTINCGFSSTRVTINGASASDYKKIKFDSNGVWTLHTS